MMWATRSVGNHDKSLLVTHTHTKAAECIQPAERNLRVAVLHSEGALHDESVLRAVLIHLIEMWVLHARCTLEQSHSVSPCIDTAGVRCSLLPRDQCSLQHRRESPCSLVRVGCLLARNWTSICRNFT